MRRSKRLTSVTAASNCPNLQIDGTTAKAAYIVVVSPKNTMTQDMTFVQKDGSWKVSSDMFFPAPIEVNNQ